MKDTPILMRPELVAASLAGRKDINGQRVRESISEVVRRLIRDAGERR